jgi:hypothetical protein
MLRRRSAYLGTLMTGLRHDGTQVFGPVEDPDAPKEVLRNRAVRMLWDTERRISLAADYGTFICQMLNDGREQLKEIEQRLREWGLSDDQELQEKIEDLRDLAKKIEYDNELD